MKRQDKIKEITKICFHKIWLKISIFVCTSIYRYKSTFDLLVTKIASHNFMILLVFYFDAWFSHSRVRITILFSNMYLLFSYLSKTNGGLTGSSNFLNLRCELETSIHITISSLLLRVNLVFTILISILFIYHKNLNMQYLCCSNINFCTKVKCSDIKFRTIKKKYN